MPSFHWMVTTHSMTGFDFSVTVRIYLNFHTAWGWSTPCLPKTPSLRIRRAWELSIWKREVTFLPDVTNKIIYIKEMPVIRTIILLLLNCSGFQFLFHLLRKSTDLNVNEFAKTRIKSLIDLPNTRRQTITTDLQNIQYIYLKVSLFREKKLLTSSWLSSPLSRMYYKIRLTCAFER